MEDSSEASVVESFSSSSSFDAVTAATASAMFALLGDSAASADELVFSLAPSRDDEGSATRLSRFSCVQKLFKSMSILVTVSPWPELIRSTRVILYGSTGLIMS